MKGGPGSRGPEFWGPGPTFTPCLCYESSIFYKKRLPAFSIELTYFLRNGLLTYLWLDRGVSQKNKKTHLFSTLGSLKLKGRFFCWKLKCSKLIKKSLFWDDWDYLSGSWVAHLVRPPLQSPGCRVLGSDFRVPVPMSGLVPSSKPDLMLGWKFPHFLNWFQLHTQKNIMFLDLATSETSVFLMC